MNLELFRPIFSVAVVFLLLAFILWKFGKLRLPTKRPASTETLSRCAHLTLTAQHSLHVVSYRGKDWIVATFPGGCTTLQMPQEMDRLA